MNKRRRVLVAVATLGLVSCSLDEPVSNVLLAVNIGLSSATVPQGGSVNITIVARNVGSVPLTLSAPSDCLLFFQVNALGGQIVYRSLDHCTAEPTTHTIAPDDEFEMTTSWDGRGSDGIRVVGATYLIRGWAALSPNAILGSAATVNVE